MIYVTASPGERIRVGEDVVELERIDDRGRHPTAVLVCAGDVWGLQAHCHFTTPGGGRVRVARVTRSRVRVGVDAPGLEVARAEKRQDPTEPPGHD